MVQVRAKTTDTATEAVHAAGVEEGKRQCAITIQKKDVEIAKLEQTIRRLQRLLRKLAEASIEDEDV